MCRLTSADKGRTDAAASFRHGRNKQTGVALAARLLPAAAADSPRSGRRSPSRCRFLPHKQTHKQATLFLTSRLFSLIMPRSFSLSPSISSAPNELLNSVSSEAVSLIKSFKLLCSQMSAACRLRIRGRCLENSKLRACCTPRRSFIASTGKRRRIKALL